MATIEDHLQTLEQESSVVVREWQEEDISTLPIERRDARYAHLKTTIPPILQLHMRLLRAVVEEKHDLEVKIRIISAVGCALAARCQELEAAAARHHHAPVVASQTRTMGACLKKEKKKKRLAKK